MKHSAPKPSKKLIRRLAIASFRVRSKDYDDPTDIDLHADNDWARAEAVYAEMIKLGYRKEKRK